MLQLFTPLLVAPSPVLQLVPLPLLPVITLFVFDEPSLPDAPWSPPPVVEVWLGDPLSWRLIRSLRACVETGAESTCVTCKARRTVGKRLGIFMLGEKWIAKVLEKKCREGLLGVSEKKNGGNIEVKACQSFLSNTPYRWAGGLLLCSERRMVARLRTSDRSAIARLLRSCCKLDF